MCLNFSVSLIRRLRVICARILLHLSWKCNVSWSNWLRTLSPRCVSTLAILRVYRVGKFDDNEGVFSSYVQTRIHNGGFLLSSGRVWYSRTSQSNFVPPKAPSKLTKFDGFISAKAPSKFEWT